LIRTYPNRDNLAMILSIALLRAINVGGRGKVAMSDLRDFFTELGFSDVRTLLQTGNVVFRSDDRSGSELERELETEAAKRLDLRTGFLVRTADEWERVVERNPFPDEARDDPSHLLVMFLKNAPAHAAVEALQAAVKGREVIRVDGPHAYITYPDGIGTSRLTNAVIESNLGTRGTGRNWNTVLKLANLIQS
jgi:uncharacterized protein (DUF1697 family)